MDFIRLIASYEIIPFFQNHTCFPVKVPVSFSSSGIGEGVHLSLSTFVGDSLVIGESFPRSIFSFSPPVSTDFISITRSDILLTNGTTITTGRTAGIVFINRGYSVVTRLCRICAFRKELQQTEK